MTAVRQARTVRWTLAVVAAGAAALWLLSPPAALPPAEAPWTAAVPIARGVYHVHSTRSDGSGTVDEIAAAAARAGLDFLIMTDHGDGTRTPDPPAYRSGVLCIDGVEVSTTGGHYVALDMPAAPYPLGGAPETVVEDVARLGGFGIVAHPDSNKADLAWRAWDAPFAGVEWLNADSQWRTLSYPALARLVLTYWLRPPEALASAFVRPARTLERWDGLTAARRVPALAGSDAHARLRLGDAGAPGDEPGLGRTPSYESAFAVFHNNLVLDRPLEGDAARDAARVLAAIREGRVFTTIDALARGGAIDMAGRSGDVAARMGGYLEPRGPVQLDGRVAAPPGAVTVVLRDGTPIYETRTPDFHVDIGERAGAYRVEVRLAGKRDVPWLLTNPIYVGLEQPHLAHGAAPASAAAPAAVETRDIVLRTGDVEAERRSRSTLTVVPGGDGEAVATWVFDLGGGPRGGQYAAMRAGVSGLAGFEGLTFRVRAETPMRVWVQLRAPTSPAGERWGRTFYADATPRDVTVRFADCVPIGATASARPALDRIDSLLFVADTVNTAPDAQNVVTIERLRLDGPR